MHLHTLKKWLQVCMFVVFAASMVECSRKKHHHKHRHLNVQRTKLHKENYKRTIITKPAIGWEDDIDGDGGHGVRGETTLKEIVYSKSVNLSPKTSTSPNKQDESLYTNTPLSKKQEIFEEVDDPIQSHDRYDHYDYDPEIANNHKKANAIDQEDYKRVEDVDTAVSDAIDSIIGDDTGLERNLSDEKDSGKMPTVITPTIPKSTLAARPSSESIGDDVELAFDENTEHNKHTQKEDYQPNLVQPNRQQDPHNHHQQNDILQSTSDEDESVFGGMKGNQLNIPHFQNEQLPEKEQQHVKEQQQFGDQQTFSNVNLDDKNDDKQLQKDQQNQKQVPNLILSNEVQDNDNKVKEQQQLVPLAPTQAVTESVSDDHPDQSWTVSLDTNRTGSSGVDQSGNTSEDVNTGSPPTKSESNDTTSLLPMETNTADKLVDTDSRKENQNDISNTENFNNVNNMKANGETMNKAQDGDTPASAAVTVRYDSNNNYDDDLSRNDKNGDLQDAISTKINRNISSSNTMSHDTHNPNDDFKNSVALNDGNFNSTDEVNPNSSIDRNSVNYNKTSTTNFMNDHPIAFKVLMEYFQKETQLQEKLQNKLKGIKESDQSTKKSDGMHSKLEPLPIRQFIAKLLKLAKESESKNANPALRGSNTFEDEENGIISALRQHFSKKSGNRKKEASNQALTSRKDDVVSTNNRIGPAKTINVTPKTQKLLIKAYVTQPTMSSMDVNYALNAMENTINRLLSKNGKPYVSPTRQIKITEQVLKPNITPTIVLDSKSLLYRKRLKSLEISLSQDFFSFWMYHFKSFEEMSINPEQLRSGIASLGSTARLGRVVWKALKGKTVNILIVGGSISAGGGLERDRHDVHGIYFRAFEQWWKKVVEPITGSTLQMDVVAIGGTDSEYFSYCIKNYIKHLPDLVLWELAANDYRRYLGRNIDPAKPLEQLTRVLLTLPSHPAIIFVNFFRGDYYKTTLGQNCPDSEDEGGRLIAEYYKITSLSWRNVICSQMKQEPAFNDMTVKREFSPLTLKTLFSSDGYHPSLLGHAQCASLLISYVRSVFEEVVSQEVAKINTGSPKSDMSSNERFVLPRPIYDDPPNPNPMCWTLLASDYHTNVANHLPNMRVVQANGFTFTNITRWPVRADRLRCLKALHPGANLVISFFAPTQTNDVSKPIREIVLISHNSFSGSANVWLDNNEAKPTFIDEPTGQRRTQIKILSRELSPGGHVITIRAVQPGFCVSGLAIL